MSSDDSIDDSKRDDQFDAFLKGEDALSQRLRALPLPPSHAEPSAALDAAILARAAAALEEDGQSTRRPQAANDPAPAEWRPAAGRWRIPAGLAAMLLAGVLTHRTWQETNRMEQVDAPAAQPPAQPQPRLPSGVYEGPQAGAPTPVVQARTTPHPKAPAQVREQVVEFEAKPAEPEVAAPPPPFIPPAVVSAPAPAMPAPSPRVEAGAAPTLESTPHPRLHHDGGAARAAPAAAAAAAAAAAPAPSVAPDSGTTPEAWLDLITEMLAAGLKADTLAEWEAFRAAHPDYPVDPALEKKISELRKR
jgi:hypothetical protein